MLKNSKALPIVAAMITVVLIVIAGCEKDTTVVIEKKTTITGTVSFANDIVPIFAANCNATGCHNSGGRKPDLSAAQAYTSLINGSYINMNVPENSEIYLWLTGERSPAMPMGAASNPSSINELILAWITQGAENN